MFLTKKAQNVFKKPLSRVSTDTKVSVTKPKPVKKEEVKENVNTEVVTEEVSKPKKTNKSKKNTNDELVEG